MEHKYYVPFLDLAVVYYIDTQLDYKNAPEHRGTAVTKDIFKIWSVEPEVIWKQVLENMGKESLFLMLVVTEEENSLMTFEDAFQKNQGALALLQKSILDEAKKKLEEPFYILPVSIFELMIVPESQADEVEEMKKAIIEYREKNGKIKNLEELSKVPGVGDSTLEKIKPHVRFN